MRPEVRRSLLLGLVLFCLPLLLAACKSRGAPEQAQGRVVSAETLVVTNRHAVVSRSFPGQVESRNVATLSAKTGGTVVSVLLEEGARVEQGQEIMRLDDAELGERIRSLEESGRQAEMERQSLEAKLERAGASFRRMERLVGQGAISREDYDRSKADFDSLSRDREALVARSGAIRHQVAEVSAQRRYTRVVSPVSGVLSRRFVDRGAFVSAGQALASVDDLSGGCRFSAQVDEALLPTVRRLPAVYIDIPGLGQGILAAPVLAAVEHVDPATRTFTLKADLHKAGDAHPEARAGMFGRLILPLAPAGQEPKILVPEAALFWRGELPAVYVVDQAGTIRFRVVRVGSVFEEERVEATSFLVAAGVAPDVAPPSAAPRLVEVLAGLSEGETILVSGVDKAREGDRLASDPTVEARP